MGDIPLATLLQTDLPAGQLGKVFSLRATLSSAGVFLGTLVSVPLFAHVDVRAGIALAALLMLALGVTGLTHFRPGAADSTAEPDRAVEMDALPPLSHAIERDG